MRTRRAVAEFVKDLLKAATKEDSQFAMFFIAGMVQCCR